jgi:hypothetical protein
MYDCKVYYAPSTQIGIHALCYYVNQRFLAWRHIPVELARVEKGKSQLYTYVQIIGAIISPRPIFKQVREYNNRIPMTHSPIIFIWYIFGLFYYLALAESHFREEV